MSRICSVVALLAVGNIHEVLAAREFRHQFPRRLVRLVVDDVAAGSLEIDRHAAVVGAENLHRQDVQQLLQVGPMVLAVSPSNARVGLGKNLRFFGDGYQRSKLLERRRYWRVPVMDGEFLVEDRVGVEKGVAGGNVIIQSIDMPAGLAAARRAIEALSGCTGVIAPFPGGVARSGSKVGSRYSGLPASTADAYCPTLRGRVETKLHEGVNCVYEIVLDGIDEAAVAAGMKTLVHAAAGEGIIAITAGNYGGKLGKFHFHLRELV